MSRPNIWEYWWRPNWWYNPVSGVFILDEDMPWELLP